MTIEETEGLLLTVSNENGSITKQLIPEIVEDSVPKVRSPWRRYFARNLDIFVYSTLWSICLSVSMNINVNNRNGGEKLLDTIIAILFMIFIEPLMLMIFGTTVGKWVLGMRITHNDGRRMSYSEALERTLIMFCQGMGLNIPIYNLVRNWKSYEACESGEILDWEYNSKITLRDQKVWRVGAFIGVNVILFAVLFLTFSISVMPKHRGDITVSEFCQNYNRISDYYDLDTFSYLDEAGKWLKIKDNGDAINLNMFGSLAEPEYIFTEDDGIMTGMHFTTKLDNSYLWATSYQNEMILSIKSFVCAQKGCSLFSKDVKVIIEQIKSSPFEDFQFKAHGISITCKVEYSGYKDTESMGVLWPNESGEGFYLFDFKMSKE